MAVATYGWGAPGDDEYRQRRLATAATLSAADRWWYLQSTLAARPRHNPAATLAALIGSNAPQDAPTVSGVPTVLALFGWPQSAT